MDKNIERIYLMQQAYATLFVTANKIQAKADKCFKNITSKQLMLIIAVAHLDKVETTINNIASKLGSSKQNVNTIVNSMVKKGYLKVVPSVKDKRAVNVRITEKADIEIREYSDICVDFLNNVFKDFTSEEINLFWNMLKRIYEFDGVKQDGFEKNIESIDR